jgi:hypothetical protein
MTEESMDITIPVLETESDAEIVAWVQSQMGETPGVDLANITKGGPGSGAQPGHPFEGNQWGTGGGKPALSNGKALAIPTNCGGRDFVASQTVAQLGRMNVLAISGGRVNNITTPGGRKVVGLELPVDSRGGGHSVRIFLGNDDTYTVQRIANDQVVGQESGIYMDQIGEQAYQAGMYVSNPFGGHPGTMNS